MKKTLDNKILIRATIVFVTILVLSMIINQAAINKQKDDQILTTQLPSYSEKIKTMVYLDKLLPINSDKLETLNNLQSRITITDQSQKKDGPIIAQASGPAEELPKDKITKKLSNFNGKIGTADVNITIKKEFADIEKNDYENGVKLKVTGKYHYPEFIKNPSQKIQSLNIEGYFESFGEFGRITLQENYNNQETGKFVSDRIPTSKYLNNEIKTIKGQWYSTNNNKVVNFEINQQDDLAIPNLP